MEKREIESVVVAVGFAGGLNVVYGMMDVLRVEV